MTDITTPAEGTRPLRASNADRDRVSAVLHDAAAQGTLTLAEVEERLTAVYAARYRHELDTVVEDLPTAEASTPSSGAMSVRDGFRALWSGVVDLALALLRSARAHPRIAAAVTIGLFALVVAVAVLGGGVDGHEMEHARELTGQ